MQKANVVVPGYQQAFSRFEERMVLDQSSKSMANNFGRKIAHLALHFDKLPHEVPIEQVNSYLYRLTVHDKLSICLATHLLEDGVGIHSIQRLLGHSDPHYNRIPPHRTALSTLSTTIKDGHGVI